MDQRNKGERNNLTTEVSTRNLNKNIIDCAKNEFVEEKINSEKFFEMKICFIRDVAKITGYSVNTLYNLTSRDLIPHRKKRGKLYFIPTEILNWIEEGNL